MGAPLYRAIRFVHPDFDRDERFIGVGLSHKGGIAMVDEAASIRQAILLLLSTARGERVMRPAYGSDLHKLAFMPNDATTHGMAIYYVRQALERWERRVEIMQLSACANTEYPERLEINLEYRVRRTLIADRLAISINLAQG